MEGLDEYKQVVYDRYTNLNEDERGLIDTLAESPVGEVLTKLFGPEMGGVFAEDTDMQEEPMDETAAAIPTEMNMPMEESVQPVA